MNSITLQATRFLQNIINFPILFLLISNSIYSQSNSKNYELVVTPKIPLTVSQFEAGNFNSNTDLLENIDYSDGFGKITQSLFKRQNPDFQDLVQFHEYNEFGVESKRYFSFFANQSSLNYVVDAKNIQKNYYQNKYKDLTPFSETRFDSSPLNRVVEVAKGGDIWRANGDAGRSDKFIPSTNSSNEIPLLIVDNEGKIINSGFYQPQNLLTSIAKNENWYESWDTETNLLNTIKTFTDKNGNKIAQIKYTKEGTGVKKLITQYVYDEKGLLRFILTPKINGDFQTAILDKYAYQYKYDSYNRKTEQKTPGKGWEYNVFDQLDRPILTQDATLRKQNLWQFIKYDINERVAYTGKYQSALSRSNLQTVVDNFISNNPANLNNIEERSSSISLGGTTLNYTNNAFPKTDITEIVSITYYDDYDFTDSDKPIAPTIIDGQSVTLNTKGLLTANFTKTIDALTWTKNYTYYDENTRPIYNFEKNYLGGYTKTETTFDFRGKVTKNITKHKKDKNQVNDLLIKDRYEYDYAERVTGEYQSVNSQAEEAIVKNIYDELGNLKQKKVGGLASAINPLQLVSYTHNIRGWLTKINDPNAMGNSLFGLEIKHEDTTIRNNSLYDGNISQVNWKNALSNSGLKTYNYQFDKLNQLSETQFINANNTSHTTSFSEKISYDDNGNITTLKRSGNVLSNSSLLNMDNLVYSYNGNQVTKITESGNTNEGYQSIASSLDTYEYDENGNLIKDRNKGIEKITYNYLNLVQEVLFSNGKKIKFSYDASGRKLSKDFINGSITTTTNYIGGFQYLNGNLQFFPTSEGYAALSNNTFKYVYIYSDHQGNNRLSYCDANGNNSIESSEIQSATDYYAYGMSHSGEFTNSLASNYLYKLQGKEYNNEENLGVYDFGSRMYDPAIGRWMAPDPRNQFASPYVALGNNPVLLTDPNGEWAFWDDVAAMAIGGTINLVSNAVQGNVKTWGDGAVYFTTGALAGEATLYGGPEAGAAILAIGNDVYGQYRNNGNSFKNYDAGQTLTATGMAVATAGVGNTVGGYFTGNYAGLFSKVTNPLVKDYLVQSAASSSTGFVVGTGASYLSGNTLEASLKEGGKAAATNFLISSVQFGAGRVQAAYKNKEVLKQEKLTASQKEFQELDQQINQAALNKIQQKATLGSSQELKLTFGTNRPAEIGEPNSIYSKLSGDGQFVKSNYIYGNDGKIINQVDFTKHFNFESGHSHPLTTPGLLNTGHGGIHIPWSITPAKYYNMPYWTRPSTPIGQ